MILQYKGTDVFYTDDGHGMTVVFLHGFLEDHTMWDFVLPELVKHNRVITIDLLGHGKTGCIADTHLMSDMADAVDTVLKHLEVKNSILIGHSMGGYVALVYAEQNKDKIKGLCLMNSTFEEDDEERKALRARANRMVRDNFESMVRMSFANLFSESSKNRLKHEFNAALTIALGTSVDGYMAAMEGMRCRKDATEFYLEASFRKLMLLGKKDAVLDSAKLAEIARNNGIPAILFSEGHMSHIENKTECMNQIMHFIENI